MSEYLASLTTIVLRPVEVIVSLNTLVHLLLSSLANLSYSFRPPWVLPLGGVWRPRNTELHCLIQILFIFIYY